MLMHNAIAVIYTKDVKRSYLVPSKETKSDESAIAPMHLEGYPPPNL